jgi:NitT/TauT family transport system permease protein
MTNPGRNLRTHASRPAARRKVVPKYVQRKVANSLTYVFVFLLFLVLLLGLYKGGVKLVALKPERITIEDLPYALALSFLRMLASYLASIFFAYALGLLAALSKRGERVILPLLDIGQSVPYVAFFPAVISIFIGLTGGSRIGIEMAAAFLIFTSQAWNMAFAVYEAVKTIPQDNMDAIRSYGLQGSQAFWQLYGPASIPRLVYNSILSWSNGWYFLVGCEIIAVGQVKYNLPGIGNFLARAAEQDNINLVLWGLFALTALILFLDFMIWRPASAWAERFRQDYSTSSEDFDLRRPLSPIPVKIAQRLSPLGAAATQMIHVLSAPLVWITREVLLPLLWDLPAAVVSAAGRWTYLKLALPARDRWHRLVARAQWVNLGVFSLAGGLIGVWAALLLYRWLKPPWPSIAREIPLALLMSTLRLIVALAFSCAWTIPLVLLVWNKPKIRQTLTTIAQVGASLPAIALFPLLILVAVKRFGGGMEMASVVLLITGMQWYVLFNMLSGVAIIPGDLSQATQAYGLSRLQTWRKLVLPAVRPALVTGALTAWGGGWNALVVSEYVPYKGQILTVRGLGALLSRSVFEMGDSRAMLLCIAAMVTWIIILNNLVWRPLYASTAERYRFDG